MKLSDVEHPSTALAPPTDQAIASLLTRGEVRLLIETGVIPADTPVPMIRLFARVCATSGLSPFKNQIHMILRNSKDRGASFTIQTSIDGARLVADRTGRYMPGPEPLFTCNEQGNLISATAYVKKVDNAGTWHVIAATAYFDEFVVRDRDGKPTSMWRQMPRNQLAKCAEALALRRAFPAEIEVSTSLTKSADLADSLVELPGVRTGEALKGEDPGIEKSRALRADFERAIGSTTTRKDLVDLTARVKASVDVGDLPELVGLELLDMIDLKAAERNLKNTGVSQ